MSDSFLTPLARSLPASVPFVGPEAQERAMSRAFTARLGANESVFGPSPKAVAAMERAALETWKYADPESHDLRHALAAHHGLAPENIVVGEGIDALLGYLVRLTVERDIPVVTSAGAYPTFNYHVTGYGGTLHTVPYHDDMENPVALLEKARETGARLVYLANPDNPMGLCHFPTTIEGLQAVLPEGCLLVLDEAYAELARDDAVLPLNRIYPNVIRTRTFSKAYGMAGARVGYAVGPAGLIAAFERVRNHFGMSRISQAGALAALEDTDWLTHVREEVRRSRQRIGTIARGAGLTPLHSETNFVAIDCGGTGDRARAILAALGRRGIFVRMPFVAPQDRCIRVSCGTEADLDAFEAALSDVLANEPLPA